MPVLFTLFFGFAFAVSDPDPRLQVGVLDQDHGALSAAARADAVGLRRRAAERLKNEDLPRSMTMVRDGKLAAAVFVPPTSPSAPWPARPLPLTLIAPASPAGQTAGTAIQSAGKRLLGSVESARLAAQAAEQQRPFADAAAREPFLEQSLALRRADGRSPTLPSPCRWPACRLSAQR